METQKASISLRVGAARWMSDSGMAGLLAMLEEYPHFVDEITLFTSGTHAPLTLGVIEKLSSLLKDRMTALRGMGYASGINVLATIGHHEENLSNSLSGDYTMMTDIDGNTCKGSFCPNDPNLLEYVKILYTMLAQTGPDYIWVDDDIRLFGHMPITCGCFCERCLSIFEEETGLHYSREQLKGAFVADSLHVRRAWLEHNRSTIARLLSHVEETVHGVDAELPIGFMTGDRFFEGYDFGRWAEVLSGGREIMWRPGGGFYSDDRPRELLEKAHEIGRQVSMLPESMVRIQAEIENFPYQSMKKSTHITALEAAAYIAAGCTGAAYNVLPISGACLAEHKPLIAKLHEMRPFYDLLAQTQDRERPCGICLGWQKDIFAVKNLGSDWFASGAAEDAMPEVFDIGLPAAYSPERAPVTLLRGDAVLTMNKDELEQIFSSGVYMDGAALGRLHEMGLGDLTGFSASGCFNDDCIESFTDDPLNASFCGAERDCRQSFQGWHVPATALVPIDSDGRTIARIVDYSGEIVADCCMGLYENRLGGRVCVAGYYPWTYLQSLSKASQMKSVIRWLSHDSLPSYIGSFHRASVWAREKSAVVINSSLDTAEDMVLMVCAESETIRVFNTRCEETRVSASGSDGPYKRFVLPAFGPWDIKLITAKE